MKEQKKSFFHGGMGRYLLPGIVLQSVLIGGGYATGREIVEYCAKFGAWGWVSGLMTFVAFAVIAGLTFEVARIFRLYDYKSIVRTIAGPLWIVYDVIYFLLLFLIISIMASATGEILEQTVGLDYMVGVVILIVVVGLLNYHGAEIIQCFETYGTILLYIAYIIFTVLVISKRGGNIETVMAAGDMSFNPAPLGVIAWTGVVYASYNLSAVPAGLFTLKQQKTRKEAVLSGVIAALLMVIPLFMTYFAILSFYPDEAVLGATVPWLVMFRAVTADTGWLVALFGVIVGWTLIETATGMIHALLERIDQGLREVDRPSMSGKKRGFITAVILIAALLFSRIGIIDLISKGYQMMAYGFIIIYFIPLLTVGLYKVVKYGKKKPE